MPRIGPLIAAVRHSLPKVAREVRGAGARIEWPAPPRIVGDIKVDGVAITPYLDFSAASLDDIRGVYEEYIHYYVVKAETPVVRCEDFLPLRLNLDPRVTRWFLGRDVYKTPGRPLAALVAMAANKLGKVPEVTESGVVLDVGGTLMGIQADGLVLSKYAKDTFVPVEDYRRFLLADSDTTTCSVSRNLATFYRAAMLHRDESLRRPLSIALRVLYYRYGHIGRLTSYLYEGIRHRSPRGMIKNAQVTKVLKRVMVLGNPMPMMWRELVETGAIPDDIFMEAFGEDVAYRERREDELVNQSLVIRWYEIVKTLGKKH